MCAKEQVGRLILVIYMSSDVLSAQGVAFWGLCRLQNYALMFLVALMFLIWGMVEAGTS